LLGIPSGFLQPQVDEVAAGVGFVVVVAVGLGLVLGDQGIAIGFGLGQFGFGLAGAFFGKAFQCFGLGQLLGKGLELLTARGGFGSSGAGDGVAVKGELAEAAACAFGAVVASNPVQQVKEVFGELQGVAGADGDVFVDGPVANALDEANFGV
jgi:hypothetical protein